MSAVRLPVPGGDDQTWGSLLNDFLRVAHNDDGTLKSASGAIIGDIKAKRMRSYMQNIFVQF